MTQLNQINVNTILSLDVSSNHKVFAEIIYDYLYGEKAEFHTIVRLCKMVTKMESNRISRIGDKCLFAIQNGHREGALLFCHELFRLGKTTDRNIQFSNYRSRIFHGVPERFKKDDLIDEVQALVDEGFEDITYNVANHVLSVVTEEIIIQDFNLGKFRINYYFATPDDLAHFTVGTLTPQYPLGQPENTNNPHPHITGGRYLCCGNMADPINASLLHNRLYDFFIIVRSVLGPQGYCAEGSYVRIESWYQVSCYECGCHHDKNNVASCYICKADGSNRFLCLPPSLCSVVCRSCNMTACTSHSLQCYTCGKNICFNCKVSCKNCGYIFCPDCIMAESKSCKQCLVRIFERMINEKTRIQEIQAAEQCGAENPEVNKQPNDRRPGARDFANFVIPYPINNYINPFEEIDSSYTYDINKFFK